MKRKLLLLFWICFGLLLSSCSSSDDKAFDQKLDVQVHGDIQIDKAGGTRVIPVLTHGDWSATATETWLTLTPNIGTLSLTAGENNTGADRSAEVTVRLINHNKSTTFKVVQPLKLPLFISVAPDKLENISSTADEYTLVVEHSEEIEEWTYSIEWVSGVDWIEEKSITDNSVTFSIADNQKAERSALITFKNTNGDVQTVVPIVQSGSNIYDPNDPETFGYTLMKTMRPNADLVGEDWKVIDTDMRNYSMEYTEHPSASPNYYHSEGKHIEVVYDGVLKQYVYNFMSHAGEFLDGDRNSLKDRQRNEMKSRVSSDKLAHKDVNGNYGEWQIIKWKMKIPTGFMPSSSFTHIHQLKGQEGSNIGSPMITHTLRRNGDNRRFQIIHNGRASSTNKGTIVDNIPLSELEDEWIEIEQECYFVRNGYYRIKLTRISDNKVLLDYSEDDIDMWRIGGAVNVRNKFGIYRSFGKTLTDENDRPTNGIKDENIWLADFRFYEKNSNQDPQAVDD